VPHAPGSLYVYNSGASYMLSAILQHLTGVTLLDYLQPRLFEPLGIMDATWETCPHGISAGGWGLKLTTEQLARFGQLYLQNGAWQGRQLIPGDWVQQATIAQISNGSEAENDWQQGYGYQFWRCRHGAFRADGAFGQHCLILRDQDAVLVTTAGVNEMQSVLNLIWHGLLPAMGPSPLQEDTAVHQAVQAELARLALPPSQGGQSIVLAREVSGKSYRMPDNPQNISAISLHCQGQQTTLNICDRRGQHAIVCGHGQWIKGVTEFDDAASRPVAASAAWTSDDTCCIRLCFYETPFCPTLTCRFTGSEMTFDFHSNVAFGPIDRPQLVGRLCQQGSAPVSS
jgi:hypothetical protein